jgi:aspartate/methionine/tyrosine aminotransferase
LQHAVAECISLGDEFFARIAREFMKKRKQLCNALQIGGFTPYRADGTCYVSAGYQSLSYPNDRIAAKNLIKNYGIIAVPGSVFVPGEDSGMLRFCVAVCDEFLQVACARLSDNTPRPKLSIPAPSSCPISSSSSITLSHPR